MTSRSLCIRPQLCSPLCPSGWELTLRLTLRYGLPSSQVLVVWDVGLNKARNYRLFEEVSAVRCASVDKLWRPEAYPAHHFQCWRPAWSLVCVAVHLFQRSCLFHPQDSRIFLEAEVSFPTLAALVEYYYLHPLPNHQSLCLQRPYGYTPPRWQDFIPHLLVEPYPACLPRAAQLSVAWHVSQQGVTMRRLGVDRLYRTSRTGICTH